MNNIYTIIWTVLEPFSTIFEWTKHADVEQGHRTVRVNIALFEQWNNLLIIFLLILKNSKSRSPLTHRPVTTVISRVYLVTPSVKIAEIVEQGIFSPWKSPVSATTVVRAFSCSNELVILVFFDCGSLIVRILLYYSKIRYRKRHEQIWKFIMCRCAVSGVLELVAETTCWRFYQHDKN